MITIELTTSPGTDLFAQTVHVVSYQKPQCRAGTATVDGTFERVKRRVRVNYSYEEIRAWNVICFPGHGPQTE